MRKSYSDTYTATRHYDLNEFLEKTNDRIEVKLSSTGATVATIYPHGAAIISCDDDPLPSAIELAEFMYTLASDYNNVEADAWVN